MTIEQVEVKAKRTGSSVVCTTCGATRGDKILFDDLIEGSERRGANFAKRHEESFPKHQILFTIYRFISQL